MAEIDEKPIIELDKYSAMVDVLTNDDVVIPLRNMISWGAYKPLVYKYDTVLNHQDLQKFRVTLTNKYEDGSTSNIRFEFGIKLVWSEALNRNFIKVVDLRAGSEGLEPYWFDTKEYATLVPFDRFQIGIPRTYGSLASLSNFNLDRRLIKNEYPVKVMLDKSKNQDDPLRYYYVNMVLGVLVDPVDGTKSIVYYHLEQFTHRVGRDNILVKNKTNLLTGF